MMASRKTALFSFLLLFACQLAIAQLPTQVIVANSGPGDSLNWVRIGSWNLTSGIYTEFDSLPARNAQSIFIHGRNAYVCADSLLARYNLDTYQREAIATIDGVRHVAAWQDKVLVSKGLGAVTDHFEVRYGSNLAQVFTVPAIAGNCQGVIVVGDTGYVANPITFLNPTGNIAVVDLPNQVLHHTLDLDTMGKFIDHLFEFQGKVVSTSIVRFNNPQWGFVSLYDIANGTFVHHKVNMPLSQGAGIDNGLLYANFGGNVGGFDLNTGQLTNPVVVQGNWAAMTLDSVNNRLFLTRTDFETYGWLHSFDYNGNKLDSVQVDIAPVALAVDYNLTIGNQPIAHSADVLKAFPQPFGEVLNLDLRNLDGPAESIELYDLLGQVMLQKQIHGENILALELPELHLGTYLLRVRTKKSLATIKVIKAQF